MWILMFVSLSLKVAVVRKSKVPLFYFLDDYYYRYSTENHIQLVNIFDRSYVQA